MEEQLREAAEMAMNANGVVNVHFTVSALLAMLSMFFMNTTAESMSLRFSISAP